MMLLLLAYSLTHSLELQARLLCPHYVCFWIYNKQQQQQQQARLLVSLLD